MRRFGFSTAFAATIIAFAAFPAAAAILTGWSQYGAGGIVEARVVTDDTACPALIADGQTLAMAERGTPSEAFPGRVCVAAIPQGSKSLSVGGHALPAPSAKPSHIVVIGDTGCRLKGPVIQSCNDQNAWPFLKVAAHAAAEHPDLVIHVGDYLYRETPCLPFDGRCSGTPWGDNWPTWNADFFAPATPLLAAATWIIERGNHEDCKRAGAGWTAYLGRDPITTACSPRDKPLLADLGGVTVGVLDENDADDRSPNATVVAALKRDIAMIMAGKPDWIVTHHPFRGVSHMAKGGDGKETEGANATLLSALRGIDESGLSLMLAGHIHNFQIENYDAGTPPQLVVGEGGDILDTSVPTELTGLSSGGKTIRQGMSLPGFGYVVLDRDGDSRNWAITVHAADGSVMRHCSLTERKLACQE